MKHIAVLVSGGGTNLQALIDSSEKEGLGGGEIAAVVIGEEATLKRVYRTADGVMLVAENPAYQPMYFSGEELNNMWILGKAIGFQSSNIS